MDASGLVVRRAWMMRTVFLNRSQPLEGYETVLAQQQRYHHHDRNAAQQLPAAVDRASIELKFDAAKEMTSMAVSDLSVFNIDQICRVG